MSGREAGSRLGRGLASLMGDASLGGDSDRHSRAIPVESLSPNPFQPRGPIDPASLDELVRSVREQGILQPLLVRPDPQAHGRFQIIAGERRWRAAQRAELAEVPCLIRMMTDAQASAAALVENLQRHDLNAIEEAEGFRRLSTDFGFTQDALANVVGKSRSHVANTVRLLNLPEQVQAAVRNGQLSAGHARALLTHPDPTAAAQAVIDRGLNVRQTETLAGSAQRGESRPPATPRPVDPDIQALEHDLSERLGLRVSIRSTGPGGRIILSYQTLDQLDGIIQLLGQS